MEKSSAQPPAAAGAPPDTSDVYRELRNGLGRQWVNDANVEDLIQMAERDGRRVLAQELREWRSPCSPAPNPGAPGDGR